MASLWAIDTVYGTLTINSVSMHTAAWVVNDVRPLYLPNAYRFGSVIIPGASGRRPYPYRVDEAVHVLPMWITGVYDRTGAAHSNKYTGLQTNLEYLRANILTPPAAPTATLSASLLMPDASTRTADVQVLGVETRGTRASQEHPEIFLAALTLVVPSGRFA